MNPLNPLNTLIESVTNVEEKAVVDRNERLGEIERDESSVSDSLRNAYEDGARSQSVLAECLKEAVEKLKHYAGGEMSDIDVDVFDHIVGEKVTGFDSEWLCNPAREALTKIRSMLLESVASSEAKPSVEEAGR